VTSSIPERTVETWLAIELEAWFPGVRLWAPTQSSIDNWDLTAQGAGKLLIFECKGCQPLKVGHSVPINVRQLERYVTSSEFAAVRSHTFYVLPAPPWPAPPRPPKGQITASNALPAGHADERLGGAGGGCWNWFHATPATSLWEALGEPSSHSVKTRTVNTRRLPSPPAPLLPEHPLGSLPDSECLADFLEGVALCRNVPLTGAAANGDKDHDRADWRRPPGREPMLGGPRDTTRFEDQGRPADIQTPAEPELDEPRMAEVSDATRARDANDGSTPTPLAAFVPRRSLAV